MRRGRIALLAGVVALVGCGDHGSSGPAEHAGRPAKPPAGWRTVRNAQAGFTVAAPKRWTAHTRRAATLIQSRDRLVAASFAADRSEQGRDTPPGTYAQDTLRGLPDFEGSVSARTRRVRDSPYPSARVDGIGTLGKSRRLQRITVAAFQRPGRVTYAAVVFRNATAATAADEAALDRILKTLRG
jgi:hypothetical protein